MFVPRALRLRGVHEKQRPKTTRQPSEAPRDNTEADHDDALVKAMQKSSTSSPPPLVDNVDPKNTKSGPRFTIKQVTPEYVAQLAAGIELIFTDYAHQEENRAKWLQNHYRTVDGENKYIHLTAILGHPNISPLKPQASHALLQKAMHDHPSNTLEISTNRYYVRRKPSSYPPNYLPPNSFEVVDDDGLSFWDQRTIYVEPHVRTMCQAPARLAHWLTEHGQLRPKWVPIQAVHMLWNSCAFVVLSGNVMHEDVWQKWRELDKPEDWKIMTKVEHTKRTAEYIALLEQQNPRGMRKNKVNDNHLPPIARPAVLPLAARTIPAHEADEQQNQGKKRRKRSKPNKSGKPVTDSEANAIAGDATDEPSTKRRG
ncbi:4-coumarate- ligase 2 [Pyrenophora seminiperda CCB06]|uniref:4-coumarate-ligase 2 n=1 Tax=Pyrenophora seminiperda CCB06 TaxID=1302712 RepID=A0A3M7MIA2_9PLEO|nr:4-coumarate- ligase 2 [Pyrenophora seminiperda CCB06]